MNTSDINYKIATNKRFHIELSLLKISQIQEQNQVPKNDSEPVKELPVTAAPVQAAAPAQPATPVQPVVPAQPETPTQTSVSDQTSAPVQSRSIEDSSAASSINLTDDKPVSYAQVAPKDGSGKPKIVFAEIAGVKSMIEQRKMEAPLVSNMDSEYTEEDVLKNFEKFKEMLSLDDDRGYESSTIRNARFEQKSPSEWELVLGSSAEVEAFRKLEIQSWFRENLKNRTFSFQFRVEPKAEKARMLTKEEKAKEFIKAHPEVQKLMTNLDAIPDI